MTKAQCNRGRTAGRCIGWALVLAISVACSRHTSPDREAARAFVQQFYDSYVPIALRPHSGPAWDSVLVSRSRDFSQDLLRALDADSRAQSAVEGTIVGLDFDPFLASQDPCESYQASDVSQSGADYLVSVVAICGGRRSERPSVVAHLARVNDSWVFSDFEYGKLKTTLSSTLETLAKGRK